MADLSGKPYRARKKAAAKSHGGEQGSGALLRATLGRVVADVLHGQSLTEALRARQQSLADRDQALLAELAYGICREYFHLNAVVSLLLRQPMKNKDQDIHALMLGGVYQLLHTRIPAYAAIGETAGAARLLKKKWAVAVVNGVLRRFQREQQSILGQVERQASSEVRYNQPGWLADALFKAWPERAKAVLEGLKLRPPFTLRVNQRHNTVQTYARVLAAEGISSRPVPGIGSALILDVPLPVPRLPGFFDGQVSVQDAGAQLAGFLLDVRPGMRVLDACAAPGGKTGHLLELVPDLDLVAMDVDEQRLTRVAENLQRLGLKASLVAGDAAKPESDWSKGGFDRILVDAPCTATGVIRRHPDIKLLRREGDAETLRQRQQAILSAQWSLLKPGGKMLYATCSLLPQENDEQVAAFLRSHENARAVVLQSPRGISTPHGLQLLPDMLETDGFYYSLLEKRVD